MPNPDIRVFKTLEELSRHAAARFEELARLQAGNKRIFSAGLSGGSTPKLLYQILASPTVSSRISWQDVHLFQVDERCVPPDHPESNYRMIGEALLSRAPIPEMNFHRMTAEWPDRHQACEHYAQELRQVLRPGAGEWPRFDLIFLGLGHDGHTASLFPGTAAIHERTLWVRENYIERHKVFRLTLTFPVLNAAEEIIVLVAGAEKAEVLREVLEGPPGSAKFPAQRIQPASGRLTWCVDEAAARLLSKLSRSVG